MGGGSKMIIFTTLMPLVGDRKHIQMNAVRSWTLLKPRPRIVVFGFKEKGVRDLSGALGLELVDVERSPSGVPFVRDIFERGFALGPGAYVNGDIILTQSFVQGFQACSKKFKNFLMIGRRHDVALNSTIPFNAGWQQRLKSKSRPHSVGGIDYFAATKNIWGAIPNLAIGRYAWDNWLVHRALKNGVAVVNVNDAVVVFHQNHKERASREAVDSRQNLSLVGRQIGIISHATWVMESSYKVKKRK
jgi:hypothetical protein